MASFSPHKEFMVGAVSLWNDHRIARRRYFIMKKLFYCDICSFKNLEGLCEVQSKFKLSFHFIFVLSCHNIIPTQNYFHFFKNMTCNFFNSLYIFIFRNHLLLVIVIERFGLCEVLFPATILMMFCDTNRANLLISSATQWSLRRSQWWLPSLLRGSPPSL